MSAETRAYKQGASIPSRKGENMAATRASSGMDTATSAVKLKVCSLDSLYSAMKRASENVMWKDSVAGWVNNGLINCSRLSRQLFEGGYKIDRYTEFTIREPKTREIVSTRFKDRVFQRSLCDNYLTDEVCRHFIHDNAACRVYKGTDFARDRWREHLRRHYVNHGADGWVLKCDMKGYFASIPHSVAKDAMRRRIRDDWAYSHVAEIIDSFKGDSGIGLGSQVSQLIALAVLDSLDHEVKERMGIKGYVRYMDDMLLVHQDKVRLAYCMDAIGRHVSSIGLALNAHKTQVCPITQPVCFLGFSFRLTDSGRVCMRILPSSVSRERRRLKHQKNRIDAGLMDKSVMEDGYNAWRAHAAKGCSGALLVNMDGYYRRLEKAC